MMLKIIQGLKKLQSAIETFARSIKAPRYEHLARSVKGLSDLKTFQGLKRLEGLKWMHGLKYFQKWQVCML